MKIQKRTHYFAEDEDGKFEIGAGALEDSITKKKLPNGMTVIGYLASDEDCANPLEDSEGMGHIRSLSRRHINSIDYEEAVEKLKQDHTVIALSYFEHGQCQWGVQGTMGGMPDFNWDGVSFAGIWEPDDACREHIRSEAAKTLGYPIVVEQTAACAVDKKDRRPWILRVGEGADAKRFRNWHRASMEARRRARKAGMDIRKAECAVAEKCAEQACETYTDWANGNCYGHVVQVFDADGEELHEHHDSCWGYIGSKYAEEQLKENFERICKNLTEKQ